MKTYCGIIVLVLLMTLLLGCTDGDNTRRILAENGYTDIHLTGYKFFSCSKDDFYHTGFTATSPVGKRVSGTVCSGLFFKNSTIRFN